MATKKSTAVKVIAKDGEVKEAPKLSRLCESCAYHGPRDTYSANIKECRMAETVSDIPLNIQLNFVYDGTLYTDNNFSCKYFQAKE